MKKSNVKQKKSVIECENCSFRSSDSLDGTTYTWSTCINKSLNIAFLPHGRFVDEVVAPEWCPKSDQISDESLLELDNE